MKFNLTHGRFPLSSKKTNKREDSLSPDPPSYEDSTLSLEPMGSAPSNLNTCSSVFEPDNNNLRPFTSFDGLKGKSNVPYRPTKEQQRRIDLLGSGSNPLSATTSNAHTDYFDVLPSFQMFQSILKRDDRQFDENLSVNPPVYGDESNGSSVPPVSLSPQTTTDNRTNLYSFMDEVTNRLNSYSAVESDDEAETNSQGTLSEMVANGELSGKSVLDKIDRLPKLKRSPLDIQIYVTKDVPQPNERNGLESKLKEYTSGDHVNGYIVITNTSDKPVDFGLFTVSLEGAIKGVEDKGSSEVQKRKRILMKKFLKMYDLNASYGYTDVPNSAGIEYEAFSIDSFDKSQIALPNERVLQPKKKYKKFFTFKFPEVLLDHLCPDNVLIHLLPPPTTGIDPQLNSWERPFKLNKELGYGVIDARGSPVLTKDYSFENFSVNYTIEAKFIDKLDADNSLPISQAEINDPNSESEYVISSFRQYHLRFVPDLRKQMELVNHISSFKGIESWSLGISEVLFRAYTQTSTWKSIDGILNRIDREIDSFVIHKITDNKDLKLRNLVTGVDRNWRDLSGKALAAANVSSGENLFYNNERMIGNLLQVPIVQKRNVLAAPMKIGNVKLFAQIPDYPVPYTSPRVIEKFNNGSQPASETPFKANSPTNINQVYNRNSEFKLESVKISLRFTTYDSDQKPPTISVVEANLVLWSYNTELPLPFEIDYDFFYATHDTAERLNDNVSVTRENLQSLKEMVDKYINYLNENNINVSKEAYSNLKSIKSLGIKKDTIKDFFKPIHSDHHSVQSSKWKVTKLATKNQLQYVRDITLPLETINKSHSTIRPSFQTCLLGVLYCLQISVKFSGGRENSDNIVTLDVPIIAG